jgi:ribosomal-protein-alanine N-acetyltransferase
MPNSSPCRNPKFVDIRHATLADFPQMQTLEVQSSTAAHWTKAQYDALFAAHAPLRIALVARFENDDQVGGFLIASCVTDDWEIENIVVKENRKRRGIGTALVGQLVADAQAAGARSVILEVRESNVPARRLYESIGFTCEARRKLYYRDPDEDAILYRRSLQFCDKMP